MSNVGCPFWQVAPERTLQLDQPRLMGILNVTPDSFSDGGRYIDVDAATQHALRMHEDGAGIIDIGGESTRPGAPPVDSNEQISRTRPVIESIRRILNADQALLSIDTTSAAVARAALDAGADIINDISAGLDDHNMLPLAAKHHCGIILMHRRVRPPQDFYSHEYQREPDYGGDVVAAVRTFLALRRDAALDAGIVQQSIVLDPGLGFGKSVPQNYELAGRIGELGELNCQLLSAASRKSFVGVASGENVPAQRIAGSLAITVCHYLAGIRLFRVHDVAQQRAALAVAQAIAGNDVAAVRTARHCGIPAG